MTAELDVTRALARFVVQSSFDDVPAAVRHEATRSLVNWLGCALGGSRHDAVGIALEALAPFAGPPQASVLGRCERFDILHAALLNGMSAHVLDFDDTHLRTLLHPSAPVASVLLALSERQALTGADFLHAFILGVEVECRIANAIYFSHNVNWYITGTAGVFGAAAAAGRVLGLDENEMTWAFGIAAKQAAGLREMAGTMCKSFVHGRAAQNGMTAALLAAKRFTSSERAIEAPRGFAHVLATDRRLEEITDRLGERYEIALNTYKPYACGVVCHPVIDGCIQLRDRHALTPGQIAAVELRVHPLALKLAGIKAPQGGLESKWSIYHSAAVIICDGAAGERQYTDERVRDPAVQGLRERVSVQADVSLREDQAHVAITLAGGRVLERHVEHAIGSAGNPMSDHALEDKFRSLADGVLPTAQTGALLEKCWLVATLSDVAEVARMAVPKSPRSPLKKGDASGVREGEREKVDKATTIYTIGHGNRAIEEFIALLKEAGIECLVDVRAYPASRRHPQFAREALERSLADAGVRYMWEGKALGGRRKPVRNSPHTAFRNEGFRAYADHMMTAEFRQALDRLIALGAEQRAAIMCGERLPWQCHRYLISDHLVARDIAVAHLVVAGKIQTHALSKLARNDRGELVYDVGKQTVLAL